MSKFAQGTNVPVSRSQQKIAEAIKRYGAHGFMVGEDGKKAFIAFLYKQWQVRMEIPLSSNETETRRRYRVLLLTVKAKFEVLACGLKTFEEEFLSDIVMPDGNRLSTHAVPALIAAQESGRMPQKLLPMLEVD